MTTTQTLAEWLTEQIEADEAAARAAFPGPWRHDPGKEWHQNEVSLRRARAGLLTFGGEEFVGAGPLDATVGVAATGAADDPQAMADATHIARWDPARVLAECEAKRRIVGHHSEPHDEHHLTREHSIDGYDDVEGDPNGPCPTLRLLALPYADRPGYRSEWRP